MFELSPPAAGQTQWTETVLYRFNAAGGDGIHPMSSLIFDTSDNLYGTTYQGGTSGEGMSRCLLKFSKRSLRIEIYAASAI